MPIGFTYILKCNDGSYYVGSTMSLDKRVDEHQRGEGAWHTRKRLPVDLVYYERYPDIELAEKRELQLKKWRREKKSALIRGEINKLPELAKAYRDL